MRTGADDGPRQAARRRATWGASRFPSHVPKRSCYFTVGLKLYPPGNFSPSQLEGGLWSDGQAGSPALSKDYCLGRLIGSGHPFSHPNRELAQV